MRLYLAATLPDLVSPTGVSAVASAVTPALRAALVEEDEEGLELSAFLTAADASVVRIATEGAPPVRVVVSVEVPAERVSTLADVPPDLAELPSILGAVTVTWQEVVAIHVDDDAARQQVAAAVAGDEEALEDLGEVDLLWFDASELPALRRRAGGVTGA